MVKASLKTLAVASALTFACIANAAEKNPWGLVYQGAVTENVKGRVNVHPVTYPLKGLAIAANVYPARRKASPFRAGIRRTLTGIFAFNWAFVELRYTAAGQR